MLFRRREQIPAAFKTFKTFGLDEKTIRQKLSGSGFSYNILSHPKGVDITVKVESGAGSSKSTMMETAEQKIRSSLGDAVFGTDGDRMEEVVGKLLLESGKTLAVAESCTGGLICNMITNVPGCSKYFKQGFIVYDNRAKIKTLNLKPSTLEKFGAVSREAVEELSKNAAAAAAADAAVAVSGTAGPGGGTAQKPVGTVFICVSVNGKTKTEEFRFEGWRELVKIQSAQTALDMLRRALKDSGNRHHG